MSTISVKTHFAAGHRILGLTGAGAKCRSPHGHTFHVEWVFKQGSDDGDLEFGELKQTLKGLVKDVFDHGFILDRADDFREFLRAGKHKVYALSGPPTTERIAEEIAFLSLKALPKAPLLRVILQEGPENSATWERPLVTQITDHGGKVVAEVLQ